jgi:5-deoxy-glucuronate isomerase
LKPPELKIKKPLKNGKTRLVDGQLKRIKFSVLSLNSGQKFQEKLAGDELGIVLLSGRVVVDAGGKEYRLGPRRNVFRDPPWGLYLPGKMTWTIKALVKSELALCYAPGPLRGEVQLIGPKQLVVHQRGKDLFQRKVSDIMVSQVNAKNLLIGETVNKPGQWSSYPPHRHDQHKPPRMYYLEEMYLFKVNPKQGFGFQRVYTDDRRLDQALVIEDNDIAIFKKGYHPVSAAPGYELYYLWVLSGPVRVMKVKDDPAHAWIHNI